jgi:hypothetical protein
MSLFTLQYSELWRSTAGVDSDRFGVIHQVQSWRARAPTPCWLPVLGSCPAGNDQRTSEILMPMPKPISGKNPLAAERSGQPTVCRRLHSAALSAEF